MKNPFEILSISPTLDLKDLDKRYRLLQKEVHPDLYENSIEKETAQKLCAEINKAYIALKDPYFLAKSLLESLELPINVPLEQEFFMEVMEGHLCPDDLWGDFYHAWQRGENTRLSELFVKWSFVRKQNIS